MADSAVGAQVSDADFRDILDATHHLVRSVVMPREIELVTHDRVPDDIREQTKEMGSFG